MATEFSKIWRARFASSPIGNIETVGLRLCITDHNIFNITNSEIDQDTLPCKEHDIDMRNVKLS